METETEDLKKERIRFIPEVTLGHVLQLLTVAAAVVGLLMSLDKRLAAVEMQESYALEERRELKKNLTAVIETQAVMARTVDRISIMFDQHTKTEPK